MSVIVLFSSRIFIFGFFLSFLSLWYFHVVHPPFSWCSPHLHLFEHFKTVVLKSLSGISTIWSFSGTISIYIYFAPLNGPYFPVSLYVLWFLVENWTFGSNNENLRSDSLHSPGMFSVIAFCHCCCCFHCCRLSLWQRSAWGINWRSFLFFSWACTFLWACVITF